MRYLSVCSGIEAATVAWHPLGWQPVAFADVDPFASALLAHYYPDTRNLGDMEAHGDWQLTDVDLLVGGTPCQSFSVAGLRGGMADPRGNLALVYLAIADQFRPEWLVWENVPGVLSSNGGRDFGAFLGGLGELGYGFAYRVLDAQHFGVPQRRRRVFVVGCLGGWQRAAAVLFERASLRGDSAPSREAGAGIAASLTRGTDSSGKGGYAGRRQEDDVNLVADPAQANEARTYCNAGNNPRLHNVIAATLREAAVRRLTPRECERLQGFPDDYTLIPRPLKKRQSRVRWASDSARYRALGNSMAVPVMRWIGQRIQRVSEIREAELTAKIIKRLDKLHAY